MPNLIFRVHAIRRMFERGISTEEVRLVLDTGSTIETYPEDSPFPSKLVLGFIGSRALHVVAAVDEIERQTIVITAYEPDPESWDDTYRRRVKE